jgi:4-diphosphocytidyl-2-C-methyl-D-erythritol kinase
MDSIKIKAYAKINLGLDVLRKREDGYHDVRMIMQTIDLYDTLTIEKTEKPAIKLKTSRPGLPTDRRNLVYKAAAAFLEAYSPLSGVNIFLDKKIPVAAGLAGGSADAAAALEGLNELYQTRLSKTALMKLGVKLGADVPYCILKGTALSEGIGEILTPLSPMPDCEIILVKPDISVSTKYVYENLQLNSSSKHPDIASMIKAIEEGSLPKLASGMDNILQSVTVRDYPVIERIKSKMKELGAMTSIMSGSGPTVFAVFEDSAPALEAFKYFKKQYPGYEIFLTKPCRPE